MNDYDKNPMNYEQWIKLQKLIMGEEFISNQSDQFLYDRFWKKHQVIINNNNFENNKGDKKC